MKPPAAVHDRRRRRPAATTCRSCRTTAIHWNGQPIAVVLAETQEQADHAASLIRVDLRGRAGDDLASPRPRRKGTKPGAVHGRAAARSRSAMPRRRWPRRRIKVDATYRTPRHNHNAIELHAATRRLGGRRAASSTTPSQAGRAHGVDARARSSASRRSRSTSPRPSSAAASAARCLWQHQILAAAAAKLAGRPVRIDAVARGRLPRRRRAHADRAARRARRGGRRPLRRADPHRHRSR